MPWTPKEFLYELQQDPTRRVLFVEGNRDVSFWNAAIAVTERNDTVIYPISTIVIEEPQEGGERGRLLWYARCLSNTAYCERVLFFVDADVDRILDICHLDNVIMTDGRDLESYALTDACVCRLCVKGFAISEAQATLILPVAISITRPVGVLRILSARTDMRLPFQRTFERSGLRRFIAGAKFAATLDLEHLVTTLMQNAAFSLAFKDNLLRDLRAEMAELARHDDRQLIHGKDFVNILSWMFELDAKNIEAMVFMSLDVSEMRMMPNFRRVEDWIREIVHYDPARSSAF